LKTAEGTLPGGSKKKASTKIYGLKDKKRVQGVEEKAARPKKVQEVIFMQLLSNGFKRKRRGAEKGNFRERGLWHPVRGK